MLFSPRIINITCNVNNPCSVLPYAFDDLLNREGSIVVVVSPLIALMKDQVSNMIIHIEFVHQLLRNRYWPYLRRGCLQFV